MDRIELEGGYSDEDLLQELKTLPHYALIKRRAARYLGDLTPRLTRSSTSIADVLEKERAGAEHRAITGFLSDLDAEIEGSFNNDPLT